MIKNNDKITLSRGYGSYAVRLCVQMLNNFGQIIGTFSVLDLIKYLSISWDSKPKKKSPTKQLYYNCRGEGLDFVVCTTQNYHFY